MSSKIHFYQSHNSNWTKQRYEQSNLEQRRTYRNHAKYFKRLGIETTLFPLIDEQQQRQQKQNEKRNKERQLTYQTIKEREFSIESNE
jgi:hypothetical protein